MTRVRRVVLARGVTKKSAEREGDYMEFDFITANIEIDRHPHKIHGIWINCRLPRGPGRLVWEVAARKRGKQK